MQLFYFPRAEDGQPPGKKAHEISERYTVDDHEERDIHIYYNDVEV